MFLKLKYYPPSSILILGDYKKKIVQVIFLGCYLIWESVLYSLFVLIAYYH